MTEIFDIIIAINKLRQEIADLSATIKNLCKNPSRLPLDKYVDEVTACKMLHLKPSGMRSMRAAKEITFIRSHRRVMYHIDALQKYLYEHTIKADKTG